MSDTFQLTEDLHRCALQLAAGELPPGWDIVKGGGSARVAVNTALQIYYKEFPPPSPLGRLAALLRGSRATRLRKHSDALLYAGIEAPESLAWGRLAKGGEYLFTRAAAGRDVASWLQDTLAERRGEPLALRRKLLQDLGVFTGRLHATGFVPAELQASDILAELREDRFLFTLINNENTVKLLPPPGTRLLKNLAQLNQLPPQVLSRTDRMRFFTGWRRQLRELSPIEAKLLAAEAYHEAMRQMYEAGKL
ncbi:MAG: hypothetical protein V2I26_04445 [Halieaceae bacterium]|nr:hypothetical protein [Halieaceae bacterium]